MQYNPIGGFFINLFFSVLTKTCTIIMANAKILFGGDENTQKHVLECFAMTKSLFISIDMNYGKDDIMEYAYIGLDRATAIRLAKEIRRQIALLEV